MPSPMLTPQEARRALDAEGHNALVLLSRWGRRPTDYERVAMQLRITVERLREVEREAQEKLRAAAERKRDGAGTAAERERIRHGMPELRSSPAPAGERRPLTGKRGFRPGVRLAQFRGLLLDGELSQSDVRRVLGISAPESKRLKDLLLERGHVVETGELRGRSPMLRLTDAGAAADTIRFEAGTGQQTEGGGYEGAASPAVAAGRPDEGGRPGVRPSGVTITVHGTPRCPQCGADLPR